MAELELVSENQPQRTHIIDDWRAEIDKFYARMQDFKFMEPDEIFITLSGCSARASEMRTQLVRNPTHRANAFRTQEIDPFLNECDRQYKLHSRIQAVRDFDLRMTGGAPG